MKLLEEILGHLLAREPKAFLAAIVESSDDAIFGLTLDGVIGNIVPRYPESVGGVSATIEYAVYTDRSIASRASCNACSVARSSVGNSLSPGCLVRIPPGCFINV
jgi:hypothetical protein